VRNPGAELFDVSSSHTHAVEGLGSFFPATIWLMSSLF
jgi:hypothetical protein